MSVGIDGIVMHDAVHSFYNNIISWEYKIINTVSISLSLSHTHTDSGDDPGVSSHH